jgi:uncharacterized membrane protein YgcG
MNESVRSLDEAREWFINHRRGSVNCIDGARQKACDSYKEAESFFNSSLGISPARTEDDDNNDSTAIGLGFLAGSMMGDTSSSIAASDPDISSSTPDTSSGFESGGGDFGGGGSGGDY